ncbi:unnamed protein product [Owenia fusiformis]|uniref:Uncharacterized protein n=1 Tax=Owenia fusiformis TaxID=6347 RepID=A0A8J1Y3W6_OWEFU|nr:unnamed protein product [Owenia fusiformis]
MGKECNVIGILILLLNLTVAENAETVDLKGTVAQGEDTITVAAAAKDNNITTPIAKVSTTRPSLTNMTQSSMPDTITSVTNMTVSVTNTTVTSVTTILQDTTPTKNNINVNISIKVLDDCPDLAKEDWTIVSETRLNNMINKMSSPNCNVNTKELNWTNCNHNNEPSSIIKIEELLELIHKGNQLYKTCRTDFCSRNYNPMSNLQEINLHIEQKALMLQQAITDCGVDSSFVKNTTRFDECYNTTRAILPLSDYMKLIGMGHKKCVQEQCKAPNNPYSRLNSDITKALVITKVYVFSIICFMGIIGNILSFMTFSAMEKLNTSIFILKTLAIIDSIHLLLRILSEPYYAAYTYTDWIEKSTNIQNQTVADTYMKVVNYMIPLVEMAQMASAWLVVFLTLDRFIAICFPFKALSLCTMKMAKIGISIVIIGSILYIVPVYFGYVYKWQRNECTKLFFINIIISLLGQNIYYRVLYELALNLVFRNVLPVGLVLGMNARLISELRVSRQHRQNITSRTGTELEKKDKNITITLITISIVFLICIIPMVALKVWDIINYSIFKKELGNSGILTASKYTGSYTGSIIYGMVVDLLLIINSAINILVYCFVRKNFARNLWKMFKCKHQRKLTVGGTRFTGTGYSKGSGLKGSGNKAGQQSKNTTAL